MASIFIHAPRHLLRDCLDDRYLTRLFPVFDHGFVSLWQLAAPRQALPVSERPIHRKDWLMLRQC